MRCTKRPSSPLLGPITAPNSVLDETRSVEMRWHEVRWDEWDERCRRLCSCVPVDHWTARPPSDLVECLSPVQNDWSLNYKAGVEVEDGFSPTGSSIKSKISAIESITTEGHKNWTVFRELTTLRWLMGKRRMFELKIGRICAFFW